MMEKLSIGQLKWKDLSKTLENKVLLLEKDKHTQKFVLKHLHYGLFLITYSNRIFSTYAWTASSFKKQFCKLMKQ